MCQFLKAGLGLGTPPLFMVEDDLESGYLVEVLPQWKLDPVPVYGVWHANTPRSSLTSHFLNFLVGQQKSRK